MADRIIPVTLVGLIVTEDVWEGPDGPETQSRVRIHFEAKKQDWEDIESLEGMPGVVVLPDGAGVTLDPVSAAVLLKD